METQYKLAFQTMWKGIRLLISSWAVTLNKLLKDLLTGIRKHWLFSIVLIVVYVIMFAKMADSRARFHHGEIVNYQLNRSLDSIKVIKGL